MMLCCDCDRISFLPYVKGLSEQLRRCLQQQGVRAIFKSETTLRSQFVRPKDRATADRRGSKSLSEQQGSKCTNQSC